MRFRIHTLQDPFIGIGCRLPERGMMFDVPFSFHIELLFFGIIIGGK